MRFLYCRQNTIKVIGIVFLFAAVFAFTFISLAKRYSAVDSYYSHGFLVPFVCAYLIWRKRRELKALPIEPSRGGLAVLVFGLILHIISSILKLNFGSYLAIIIVLEGLILYLFGRKINRELLFPLFFLVFMLPLPRVIIIGVSFKMKILAAQIACGLTNQMGISAIRDGSIIYLPNGKLTVGDPCSGLRSLISLLALGALFTQFIRGSIIQRNILFLSAVPIALVSNVLRITALLWVVYVYGEKTALGFFHDLSGMLVFGFSFLCLILMARVLRCRFYSLRS